MTPTDYRKLAEEILCKDRYCDVKRGDAHCTGYQDDDVVCRTCAIEWIATALQRVSDESWNAAIDSATLEALDRNLTPCCDCGRDRNNVSRAIAALTRPETKEKK